MSKDLWSLYAMAVDEADTRRVIDNQQRDPQQEAKYQERKARAEGFRQTYICGGKPTPEALREIEQFKAYLEAGGGRKFGSFEAWKKGPINLDRRA